MTIKDGEQNNYFLPFLCGKLPHGSFASNDQASTHALRSGMVWEAAIRGTTGLGSS
jgi:hypothetical protein